MQSHKQMVMAMTEKEYSIVSTRALLESSLDSLRKVKDYGLLSPKAELAISELSIELDKIYKKTFEIMER